MKNKIQQVMYQRNLTQTELAKRIGIRRDYLNRIIRSKITPSVPLAIRIARGLGKFVEDLFIIE